MTATKKRRASTARIRKSAIRARRALSDDERDIASDMIADRLIRRHEFIAAKSIACYLPMWDEVDPARAIARAWRAKKRVFCPVTDSDGTMVFRELRPDSMLRQSGFGIWEPVAGTEIGTRDLDIVITPLVAFDGDGNRIGMGGGFFDRCFAFLRHRRHWIHPKLFGLAFSCQKVEKIQPNPWDIRLYKVITEVD